MELYSLYQLNEFIRRFVALNLPEAIWLHAEIAEIDERRGHYYLSLIEKESEGGELIAKGQAMMWSQQAHKWQRANKILLNDFLQVGRMVKLQVKADFHEVYGLKFVIQDIDTAFTLGHLALDKQTTIAYLQSENLWEENRQLTLSTTPQRLAIISSPMAAGLQDFLEQLHKNDYGYKYETQLFPAAMQGPQLSPEIRRQLKTINRRRDQFDAIIIIRGGGARIDLVGFDDQKLCETAATSILPIITGIGHDSDQSILDMIAHTSLKTPTAVAEFLVQRLLQFEQTLLTVDLQVKQLMNTRLQRSFAQLDQLEMVLKTLSESFLQKKYWELDQLDLQTPILIKQQLKQAQTELEYLDQKHRLLSLKQNLERGFSIVTQGGKIVNSKDELKKEEEISIHLKDGIVKLNMPKK